MRNRLKPILLGALLLGASGARATEISATPPAGYFKVTARGGSDTWVSLPLVQRTSWVGRVTAVAADRVTLETTASVGDDEAAPSAAGWYYAEFGTGALAGLAYPVLSNTDGTFVLKTRGEDLTAHALGAVVTGAAGDVVRIRSGWTLAGVFGAGADGVFAESPAFTGGVYLAGDAVLIPDNETIGTEKKPAGFFAYVGGAGWRRRGDGADTDAGAQALDPGVPFIVRRGSAASAQVVLLGYAPAGSRVVKLPALAAGEETDFAFGWAGAEGSTLQASALGGVISPSANALAPVDLLLDYAGLRLGFARSPERVFTLVDGQWLEGDVNHDGFILAPGTGYVLRLRGERPARYWRQLFSE
jgi:uncharacterized protein (TIGR02597 family)